MAEIKVVHPARTKLGSIAALRTWASESWLRRSANGTPSITRMLGVSSYSLVIVASNKGDFRGFRCLEKFGSLVVHLRVSSRLHRHRRNLHFFGSNEVALEGLVNKALRRLAVTVHREQAQNFTDCLVRFIHFLQVIRPLVVLVSIGISVAHMLDRVDSCELGCLAAF